MITSEQKLTLQLQGYEVVSAESEKAECYSLPRDMREGNYVGLYNGDTVCLPDLENLATTHALSPFEDSVWDFLWRVYTHDETEWDRFDALMKAKFGDY